MLFYRFLYRSREKIIFNQCAYKNKKKKGSLLLTASQYLLRRMFCFVSYCKRVSSCLSFKKKAQASMSVEAALVMPLFLFALINLISVIEIYRVQSNLSVAMHRTAKEIAVYGYEYQELMGEGSAYKIESLGLTYLFAARRVKDILGEEYLNRSPIRNGVNGISWLRSQVLEEEDCIDLIATYQVEPMIDIMGFGSFAMCNRIRTRAWTGYGTVADSVEPEQEELVYVAEYGTVYHLSAYCTHLKLSIRSVDIERIGEYRNLEGREYVECNHCFDEYAVTFYITDYGELAHCSLACSSLKRTYDVVSLSEVGDKVLCQRCKTLYGAE
ncbi:MAG: hypothetical protein E7290_08260 [Lachnospiraceae bacterium]|nr:hypothetical protein [Lachnospiraceae bacterium]